MACVAMVLVVGLKKTYKPINQTPQTQPQEFQPSVTLQVPTSIPASPATIEVTAEIQS